MRSRIQVKKEKMPYSFFIALGKEKFQLRFAYNRQADLFTVSLYRGGRLLCHGEPIIYGVPLFQDIYESSIFPILTMVAIDESGNETEVTWDNFGATVFLTIDDGADE